MGLCHQDDALSPPMTLGGTGRGGRASKPGEEGRFLSVSGGLRISLPRGRELDKMSSEEILPGDLCFSSQFCVVFVFPCFLCMCV